MHRTIKSFNPAKKKELLGKLPVTSEEDVHRAILCAKEAQKSWGKASVEQRVKFVSRYREILAENKEKVASLQSKEMGKPIRESRAEVESALRFLLNQEEKASNILADKQLDSYKTHRTLATREAYGVAAVITPWNFPVGQFICNSFQTLLAGNAVILKHSELCPLTARALIEIAEEADFPEHIFQCCLRRRRTWQVLTSAWN